MGITQYELNKVPQINHEEAFKRIKEYYITFMKKWQKMSDAEKAEYISVDYINRSFPYLIGLPKKPTLEDSIDLGKNVIYKQLEYLYHKEDDHGIKMAAYAHYIINTFNGGKL
jgi:hypothetical protein